MHPPRSSRHKKRVKFNTASNVYHPPASQWREEEEQVPQESEEEGARLVKPESSSFSQIETSIDVQSVDEVEAQSEPTSLSAGGLLREEGDSLLEV